MIENSRHQPFNLLVDISRYKKESRTNTNKPRFTSQKVSKTRNNPRNKRHIKKEEPISKRGIPNIIKKKFEKKT